MEKAAKRRGYKDYRFHGLCSLLCPQVKIHVLVITNPKTTFNIGQPAKHLPVGDIVDVNNKRKHSVTNEGELDRIHLIFECYNMDDYGKSG